MFLMMTLFLPSCRPMPRCIMTSAMEPNIVVVILHACVLCFINLLHVTALEFLPAPFLLHCLCPHIVLVSPLPFLSLERVRLERFSCLLYFWFNPIVVGES